MEPVATHRREVRFAGMVQGVGFRYATRQIAGGFAVSGFVQNLPDGSVRAVVEGSPDEIDRFLQAVREELGHFLADERQTRGEPTGEYRGFGIRT